MGECVSLSRILFLVPSIIFTFFFVFVTMFWYSYCYGSCQLLFCFLSITLIVCQFVVFSFLVPIFLNLCMLHLFSHILLILFLLILCLELVSYSCQLIILSVSFFFLFQSLTKLFPFIFTPGIFVQLHILFCVGYFSASCQFLLLSVSQSSFFPFACRSENPDACVYMVCFALGLHQSK